jgi:hypothetical protein
MAQHDIRLPLSNQSRDRPPVFQRCHQFCVMVIQNLRGGDAKDFGSGLDFGLAPLSQWAAGHLSMAEVAVASGNEFHLMSQLRPKHGRTTHFDLAIVGMRSEANDSEFAIGGFNSRQGLPGKSRRFSRRTLHEDCHGKGTRQDQHETQNTES